MNNVVTKNDLIDVTKNEKGFEIRKLNFKKLIEFALDEKNKGLLNASFGTFYDYSFTNTMLFALQQQFEFGTVTPVASMSKWNELGRNIKKGSHGLSGYVPCMSTMTVEKIDDNGIKTKEKISFIKGFKVINKFFCLTQTVGDDLDFSKLNNSKDVLGFDVNKMVEKLKIKLIPFEHVNGNVGGYAKVNESEIAINPVFSKDNNEQVSTLMHEIGHCLLHKDSKLDKAQKECEAEMVAYLVMNTISDKYNTDYNIDYIKGWLKRSPKGFTNEMCERVLKAVSKITKAIKESV